MLTKLDSTGVSTRLELHTTTLRVHPLDVGCDLRLHDIPICVPPDCDGATYEHGGERWLVRGPRPYVIEHLVSAGYTILDHDDGIPY